jgi:hypothetical protein
MSTPQAMPAKLIVVLVLLSLSLALSLYNVTGDDGGGAANYIRIGLNLGLLIGLLRGQEWARMLAKITAVLSLIGGGLLLMQLLALGSAAFIIPTLGYVAYAGVVLMIVYGVFLLWCMNQQDVVEWLGSRQLRD